MKLPALPVCHLPDSFGKTKQMTVMGEILTEGLSDAGSTPARSIYFADLAGDGPVIKDYLSRDRPLLNLLNLAIDTYIKLI